MKVAYLFETENALMKGDSSQAITLCENADFFTPVSIKSIGGSRKIPCVEVPSDRLGSVYYPMPSPEREEAILSTLEEIDPDAVLIHTLSSEVLSEVEKISERWPTCLRLGTNYLEFWLSKYRNRIDNILWAIDHVDAVIAPSRRVKKNLEVMGLRNVVVIPTAIDFDSWELSDGGSNTVVTISRMDPIKCHITPILALKKLGKRIPDLKYKIYGSGGLRHLLDKLLKVLGADWISPEGF